MRVSFFELQDGSVLYIGETNDIKAMYKSISRNNHTMIKPLYSDTPIFSETKEVYGLSIEGNWMTVINSDTALKILMQEGFVGENEYRWISIKKRLPKDGETVIISTKGGFTTTVTWNQKRKLFEEVCNFVYTPEFVIKWMPYPHPHNQKNSVTHRPPYYPVNISEA